MREVERFYDAKAQYEWDRLERHRTEFAVTLQALKDSLPQSPASVLDAGGGPGHYAIALTGLGYTVTLFDLSQACLELARQKAIEAGVTLHGIVHGDARSLSRFTSETFDAVLLLGPLYHLLEDEDRRAAIREAARVLRPQGRIFASFITRIAVVRWAAKEEPGWITSHGDVLRTILETGAERTKAPDSGFTVAYFARPTEIVPLMESEGFETLDLLACEGVISMIEERVNALTGELFGAWVRLNYALGRDPSVHGTAEHLLYVGQKR